MHELTKGLLDRTVAEEPLEKMSKPGPRFPGIGLGDDRRETRIVKPNSTALKTSIRAMNAAALQIPKVKKAIRQAAKNFARDTPVKSPLHTIERAIANEYLNVRTAQDWNDGLGAANGATSVSPTSMAGYAMTNTDDPNRKRNDPRSAVATKLHEETHQMLMRVQKAYGPKARYAVVRHLLDTMPQQGREALNRFMKIRYGARPTEDAPPERGAHYNFDLGGQVKFHPYGNEEHITTLLNYMNSPEERSNYARYGRHMNVPEGETGTAPGQPLHEDDKALKMAYAHVINEAKSIDRKKLNSIMRKYKLPAFHKNEETMHPLTKSLLDRTAVEKPLRKSEVHPLTKSLLDGMGSFGYLKGMNITELRKDQQPLNPQQPNVSVPAGQEDWPTTVSGRRHPPHPAYNGGHVAIISAEDPHSDPDADATGGNVQLAQDLRAAGLKFEPSRGKYGTVENGFVVHNPPEELMLRLAHKYGQESVVFSRGGKNKLVNVNGNSAGMAVHGEGLVLHDTEPEDFYTTVWHPNGQPTHFTYNLDFENGVAPHPLPPGLIPKPPKKTTVAV